MEATTIIRKPLITEKATAAIDEGNHYVFEVDRRATKTDIRRAVEELYKVRVMKVATQNRQGRQRRMKYGYVDAKTWKRATVKIHAEDRIELF